MKDKTKEILDRLKRIDHKEYIAFEFADSATFDEVARCFEERKKMADYITNLQEELERCIKANVILDDENGELQDKIYDLQEENESLKELNVCVGCNNNPDYKSRNEKVNWWLKEMLKQVKSDETKAIINGTLELLLNGGDEE